MRQFDGMDRVFVVPFAVHPYQKFLTFTAGRDDMDLTAGAAEAGAYHRDVGHGRELYEHVPAYSEDFVLERKYVPNSSSNPAKP